MPYVITTLIPALKARSTKPGLAGPPPTRTALKLAKASVYLAATQRSVELRRNQRDVATVRQRADYLRQVAQIGTHWRCTRAVKTRAGQHHQAGDVVRGQCQRPVASSAQRRAHRLDRRADRCAGEYDAFWCSSRTGRGDDHSRVSLGHRLCGLEHRDRPSLLDRVRRQWGDGRTATQGNGQRPGDVCGLNQPEPYLSRGSWAHGGGAHGDQASQ